MHAAGTSWSTGGWLCEPQHHLSCSVSRGRLYFPTGQAAETQSSRGQGSARSIALHCGGLGRWRRVRGIREVQMVDKRAADINRKAHYKAEKATDKGVKTRVKESCEWAVTSQSLSTQVTGHTVGSMLTCIQLLSSWKTCGNTYGIHSLCQLNQDSQYAVCLFVASAQAKQ